MTETKALGRIVSAMFGWGGYQDTMIGLTVVLDCKSFRLSDFQGVSPDGDIRDFAVRVSGLGSTCLFLSRTLTQAKVKTVDKLVGVPVEVTLLGTALKSWRVLEEVL